MNIITTKLHGVLILEPKVFTDERGWFMESFNERAFNEILTQHNLPPAHFVQDNHSKSAKGVLRGLHYQLPPFAQGKLVRVVQGRAFDVAVDLRKDSPTFGQWTGVELTTDNHRQFWIPEGFAHGFIALEDDTHFLYKTTNFYDKNSERSIVWNDVDLKIDWQINNKMAPKLTEKDDQALNFRTAIQCNNLF
ncbi:MAG: dTDP-4-dehydrorhamnose 3,5-epimerase [Moraxella sp.]|nr:dTDP-4-dehydrorhamnose 3,5-epimerase [Moraxella sp.]